MPGKSDGLQTAVAQCCWKLEVTAALVRALLQQISGSSSRKRSHAHGQTLSALNDTLLS
jgi:sigma54-dependent transcription regulator